MSDAIKPALSAEEWRIERATPGEHLLVQRWYEGIAEVFVKTTANGGQQVRIAGDGAAHALAALCLYQQPFGFTHGDLVKLRAMPDGTGYASIDDSAWFDSLIARIAALLPPEP